MVGSRVHKGGCQGHLHTARVFVSTLKQTIIPKRMAIWQRERNREVILKIPVSSEHAVHYVMLQLECSVPSQPDALANVSSAIVCQRTRCHNPSFCSKQALYDDVCTYGPGRSHLRRGICARVLDVRSVCAICPCTLRPRPISL